MKNDLKKTGQTPTTERVLLALEEAAKKLEEVRKKESEPIAIIGMGCRLPGGADDPASFWRLLEAGVDAISETPPDRWDVDALHDPDPDAPGKICTRFGGFLSDVAGFDHRFFGVSPMEALSMDPQQRLLLEVSCEAAENAGLPLETLKGSRTGVFVGITTQDYSRVLTRGDDFTKVDAWHGPGNTLNAAAGRLSYTLGLQGPCMAVDTACSSSLAAIHLACRSLRSGEIDLALAGGVNLILSPEAGITLSRARMLAPDGRCKTFDDAADGYARGEGCGVLVLKRLSNATADGNRAWAHIRGSAINHGGRTSGFTVPSGRAQRELMREALKNAGASPARVQYLEAHGAGTSLGDPIELNAAADVYGEGRPPDQPLYMGSVKTNIGHLESASGVAGLIKTTLALAHKTIPPHLHLKTPNTHAPWETLPVKIPVESAPWPPGETPPLAGVSSFGASGVNAHVILEGAAPPRSETAPREAVHRPLHILTLSAKSEEALKQLAGRCEKQLAAPAGPHLGDLCYSANTGRSHHPRALYLIASTREEALAGLAAFSEGREAAGGARGRFEPGVRPGPAFLFTGQGAQGPGMGKELYDAHPRFRQTLDQCAEILRDRLERPLIEVIHQEGSPFLHQTAYTQPALFALEIALLRLWESWGVRPGVVMGHSVGEYAAACAAGVFSMEDGLKLIAERGRLMQSLPPDGRMAAVSTDEAAAVRAIRPFESEASVAAINTPGNTVISGKKEAVEEIIRALKADGVTAVNLNVSHAFHSPLMDPVLPAFERAAARAVFHPPKIDLISNLTGRLAGEEIASPAYWRRHVRRPVRFAAGMETLHQRGCNAAVEIGPRPILSTMGRQCLPDMAFFPSLQPGRGEWRRMLESLGALYIRGATVDWRGFHRGGPGRWVDPPTYPFQRKRFWPGPARPPERRTPDPSPPPARTAVLQHLERGDVGEIMAVLKKESRLTAEQLRAAPRVLGALVQEHKRQERETAVKDWLYQVQWRPAPDQGPRRPTDWLPPPPSVVKSLSPEIEALKARADLQRHLEVVDRLEGLCIHYVLSAFRDMGWEMAPGRRFSYNEIEKRLGVAARHRPLLHRLLAMLVEENLLRRERSQFEAHQAPVIQDPGERIRALQARRPSAGAELTLLDRCGSHLARVLRDEIDPLGLLFPEGDLTTAAALYTDSPAARAMNEMVQKTITAALRGLPPGRTLNILEIGAGVGGTTAYILPRLPSEQTEYTFTDLSPLFTTRAKETFRDHSFIRYRPLDIEQSPETQGFTPGHYDLVLAANVLHAVMEPRRSLARIHRLLAPGGALILLEGTRPLRLLDLIFGLTEGWWRYSIKDPGRPHPLLTAREWRRWMEEAGLEQTAAVSAPRGEGGLLSLQAVIMAQKPGETRENARETPALLPAPLPAPLTVHGRLGPGPWLIFADDQGIGDRLARLLEVRGARCILARPGKAHARISDRERQLNPAAPDHFRGLLNEIEGDGPLRGVVYAWGLNQTDPGEMSASDLERHARTACGGALGLVQALARLQPRPPFTLFMVTRGAAAAAPRDRTPGLAQSPLWGMGGIIALEHPERPPRQVDLDPLSEEDPAEVLLREILTRDREPRVAVRAGVRLAARLARRPAPPSPPPEPPDFSDGTHVITGGLGDLGLLTAQWLASRGAGHLALVGRGPGGPGVEAKLAELRKTGVSVTVHRADVSRIEEMARVLTEIPQNGPPPRGVFHAAGVLDDGVLRKLTWDRFRTVLAPKALGAWNLHILTRDLPLHLFVLYSSGASMVGSPGQANHAAANAFLDALAHYRAARGLPALSINWGPWARLGAAARRRVAKRMRTRGVDEIPPRQGIDALEQLILHPAPRVGVLPIQWPRFLEQTAPTPFFEDFQQPDVTPEARPPEFLPRFTAAPPGERLSLLRDHIRRQAADVLGVDDPSSLDAGRGFLELGMDSLTSVELRNRLQVSLSRPLPATLVFDHPTMDKLARRLHEELTVTSPPPGVSPPPPVETSPPPLTDLDHLSEEELGALLDQATAQAFE